MKKLRRRTVHAQRWGAPEDQAGFTLVELLLVLVVVVILAALTVPTLGRAKARGHGAYCLNNLRQWGIATHLFASDNDDLLPKDGAPNGTSLREGWYVDLPRIIGLPTYHAMAWRTNADIDPGTSLWICPGNRRRSNGNNLFHYCLNQHINDSGAGRQVMLGSVRHPESAVWLFDNGKLAAVAQQNNVHTNVHRAGAQFLFIDGHVRRFAAREYWDFKLNRGRTNHDELRWNP